MELNERQQLKARSSPH